LEDVPVPTVEPDSLDPALVVRRPRFPELFVRVTATVRGSVGMRTGALGRWRWVSEQRVASRAGAGVGVREPEPVPDLVHRAGQRSVIPHNRDWPVAAVEDPLDVGVTAETGRPVDEHADRVHVVVDM